MIDHHHDHDRSACHALLGGLSDYLDGEAEQALCDEIERHMEECEDCRVVIDTLAKTITLYREHGHTPLPPDARRRLYAALDLSDYLEGR